IVKVGAQGSRALARSYSSNVQQSLTWKKAQQLAMCSVCSLCVYQGDCYFIGHNHYNHQGYRIKPHGQLVSVSSTHYCASTPDLSTSWSRTALQGSQAPGRSNLQTSFPLRCLQRLSLPYIATRQCHWHDNRYTRGTSIPVLSY